MNHVPESLYVVLDDKVRKPINQFYGGKDRPMVFNNGFVEHNEKGGYVQSKNDLCVFVKFKSENEYTWIYAHVDDFKCFATSLHLIEEYKDHLSLKYTKVKNTDEGDYLGIHEQKVEGGSIFTMPRSLNKLIDIWLPKEMQIDCGKNIIPMQKKYLKDIDKESKSFDSTKYRSCLGLAQQQLQVRPDIAFPISKLATRSHRANVRDYEALIQLVYYLWHTRNRGLFLRGNDQITKEFRIKLIAYADAAGISGENSRAQYAVT